MRRFSARGKVPRAGTGPEGRAIPTYLVDSSGAPLLISAAGTFSGGAHRLRRPPHRRAPPFLIMARGPAPRRRTNSAALVAMEPYRSKSAERPRSRITSALGREIDRMTLPGRAVSSLLPHLMPCFAAHKVRCDADKSLTNVS
jgi:hypothetical protein